MKNHPDLSHEWLLTHKGSMLKSEVVALDKKDGIDYKELSFGAKYTVEFQKKYIYSLKMQIENKRNSE